MMKYVLSYTFSYILNFIPFITVGFDSSSSTALIKKEQKSSCIPLWQLKIGQPLNCLTVEHLGYSRDRPILSKCDNRNPSEQKWTMIESGNAERANALPMNRKALSVRLFL